jgi:hypothetical protein
MSDGFSPGTRSAFGESRYGIGKSVVRPQEATKLGTEYERVQREMDEKLNEWERMRG